jgi:cyclic beta-1,2-glucan synthetase
MPSDWPGYSMTYRYGKTLYKITVKKKEMASGGTHILKTVYVDGSRSPDGTITLLDDEREHTVRVLVLCRKADQGRETIP